MVGACVGGIKRRRPAISGGGLLGRAGGVERPRELTLERGLAGVRRRQLAQQRQCIGEIAGKHQHFCAVA